MSRPEARPVAIVSLYREPDRAGYIVFVECPGLNHVSPASTTSPAWLDAESALKHAAELIDEHSKRWMPASTPTLALPDVSFDLDQKERP